MHFEPTNEQMALRDAALSCLTVPDAPVRNVLRALGAAGVVSAAMQGPSIRSNTVGYLLVLMEVAAARPSWALALSAHAGFCQAWLSGAGSSANEALFRSFIQGEKIGCTGQGQLNAELVDGQLRLTGTISVVPNAADADYLIVLASAASEVGAFVMPRRSGGIHVEGPHIGAFAGSLRHVRLERVIAEDSQRLEKMPGHLVLDSVRDLQRLGIAATAIGIARATAEKTVTYAKQRNRGGGPASKSQSIQFLLSDMATENEAATLAILQAATLRDAGLPYRIETASAKVLATESAVRATHTAARILGPAGYGGEQEDRHAAALALDILDATGEEELSIIAVEMLKET